MDIKLAVIIKDGAVSGTQLTINGTIIREPIKLIQVDLDEGTTKAVNIKPHEVCLAVARAQTGAEKVG